MRIRLLGQPIFQFRADPHQNFPCSDDLAGDKGVDFPDGCQLAALALQVELVFLDPDPFPLPVGFGEGPVTGYRLVFVRYWGGNQTGNQFGVVTTLGYHFRGGLFSAFLAFPSGNSPEAAGGPGRRRKCRRLLELRARIWRLSGGPDGSIPVLLRRRARSGPSRW